MLSTKDIWWLFISFTLYSVELRSASVLSRKSWLSNRTLGTMAPSRFSRLCDCCFRLFVFIIFGLIRGWTLAIYFQEKECTMRQNGKGNDQYHDRLQWILHRLPVKHARRSHTPDELTRDFIDPTDFHQREDLWMRKKTLLPPKSPRNHYFILEWISIRKTRTNSSLDNIFERL